MENTHFLTAIEEESGVADEKSTCAPVSDEVIESSKTEFRQKSDQIDFGPKVGSVTVQKPRPVDRFFANQADACLLSPIRSRVAPETQVDPTQESLDLKLEGSDCQTRLQNQPECVQPNDITLTLNDETMEQPSAEAEMVTKGSPQKEEIHSRKRLQNEMEPAMFDMPRGTKMLHREEAALPQFREHTKPILKFSYGAEEPFNPKIVGGDGCDVETQGTSSDTKKSGETDVPEEEQNEGSDPEAEAPGAAAPGNITYRGFNITLDMTLRQSGGVAFASGLFLAIDEALDPLVGALVPYGRRRRGTNIIAVCIPILLAIYFVLF